MKAWQIFKYFDCPECGESVEIFTQIQEDNDDSVFWERDPVRCTECDLKTEIAIDETYDEPRAYVVHPD
jgi:transcription elongation factor Elf1